ncbi:MAG: DMT family transporter [Armatimonadetes bacterium]|nr:DMT family transporter [Armatimonadota bacterium]
MLRGQREVVLQVVYALLCTGLFACSAFFAARATASVGPSRATLARILIATFVLGGWTLAAGCHLPSAAIGWLLLSGLVGMGLGDIAFFAGIPLVGGRLMTLLGQCLTAPIALGVELVWLGVWPDPSRAACVALILVGVALSLTAEPASADRPTPTRRRFWLGVTYGVIDALGTALGAVLTRRALACLPAGAPFDGGTTAWYRMVGGALVTIAVYRPVLVRWCALPRERGTFRAVRRRYRATVANALCGSVLGMAAMQAALTHVEAGVVLGVVATAPLGTMLLLWRFDGLRLSRRTVLGGCLAVAGVVALQWAGG